MFKSKVCIFLIVVFYFFSSFEIRGQDDENASSGMEIRKIGNINVLVPKDSRLYQMGNVITIESPLEYSAREFEKLRQRMDKLEKENRLLRDELDQLRLQSQNPK